LLAQVIALCYYQGKKAVCGKKDAALKFYLICTVLTIETPRKGDKF
jgi:hypothetical protein